MIELVAVGGNSAVCLDASVTLQCTLTGDVLTWNTPNGGLNFIRNRASESDAGFYHGRLQELNSTHLRSNLTFTFTSQITISCSDDSENTSTTISIEGIYCIRVPLKYVTLSEKMGQLAIDLGQAKSIPHSCWECTQ